MKKAGFRVLSIIPPMAQLNSPYPATAYLTGFLRFRGIEAVQEDLNIALALRLFSSSGLKAIKKAAEKIPPGRQGASTRFFCSRFNRFMSTIDPVIAFLQGKDPTLAHRICVRDFIPEGPRFSKLEEFIDDEGGDPLSWAFGSLGVQDRAKHLATLFLNDIADVMKETIDPRFELVRYAESLALSQPTFDPLDESLSAPPTLLDDMLDGLAMETLEKYRPSLVLISAPFPGSVYGAFRIAKTVKTFDKKIRTVLGGGFVNTELRSLNDSRVFEFFDFVCLDTGERPLLSIVEHLEGKRPVEKLSRTFFRGADGRVKHADAGEPDIPFVETGRPTYEGLPIGDYISVLDMLNPMHRLWSDGRWNKLTVARGCYWHRCAFCDVTLDYIRRYEPADISALVDQMEQIIAETGQRGFHFVDEAAPPKLLKALAEEITKRGLIVTWWVNVRFEKAFTSALCRLLAESGCVAVTGGLETASDRLLKLMEKGVTVEQAARVTKAFSEAGIMVHAYLMYGFPTQTVQETVDALENVRQLFEAGCIQSGFFHRFACTAHSPVGRAPKDFGITLEKMPAVSFAMNDVGFTDRSGVDHETLARGLNKALYNFMHGIGLEEDVRSWFDIKVPRTNVPGDRITRVLKYK
ncbi:MAG TPA: radical SAM protein [Acidobacteriota bacterium]|nr:radical SAM protein [Acidobacteriota bacterium]HNT17515.1 radical SAM protein [Acidobacteriota bacterium]